MARIRFMCSQGLASEQDFMISAKHASTTKTTCPATTSDKIAVISSDGKVLRA